MAAHRLVGLMLEQSRQHGLILLDDQGLMVDWLMGAQRLFGYSPEEVLGEPLDKLFTPEDRALGIPATELVTAAAQGRSEDDRWMLRKDGSRFWAGGFTECLRNPDGSIAGFSKLLRDRTDLRGHIETLGNRADAAALRHDQLLALGTLAHEIRNPLGVLANAAEVIERSLPAEPRFTAAAQMIIRQTGHVSRLIENLFENVRARVDETQLRFERVALHQILADSIETASSLTQARRQRVEALLPQTPIVIEADAVRLRQVFVNLISNAAKFSEEGSAIWIRGTTEGAEAVIRVIDNGRGIAPSMHARIFELFTRIETTHPERGEGLGLGLALVKSYVAMHGGTVQVRSEGIGRGSEFVVRLPLEQVHGAR